MDVDDDDEELDDDELDDELKEEDIIDLRYRLGDLVRELGRSRRSR